ncbi:MAG: membrane protein insertase YidC [Gammaproteobacteria bacterium]|nr:membrane protein insertase YidC [Gammaproteobacteria bacterium]
MGTTDSRRFILLCALGVILFFLYQAWQKDFAPTPQAPAAESAPPVPDLAEDAPRAAAPGAEASPAVPAAPAARRVRVETDLLVAEIALEGGELRRVELKGYPVSKQQPERNFALLQDGDGRLFVLQSGLAGTQKALVTHQSQFVAPQTEYTLAEGADSLDVTLEHVTEDGIVARKTYRFRRGSYEIGLTQALRNTTPAELLVSPYLRFVRTAYAQGDESKFLPTFKGVGYYEQKSGGGYRFVKTALEDLAEEPFESKQTGGWIALLQHYFVAAILPPTDQTQSFAAKPAKGGGYLAQYIGQAATVASGAEQVFAANLYIGPKLQKSIGQVAPGLELTVDYGILTPIAQPLFWLLDLFHKLVRNWGLAIILLTLAVKLAMFKLSEAQYRSMAKMKKFAPRIQELKDRYGDDRERMQRAMMDLYKKEGFNPLAGCWPILIQFPVFIALYWVLLESVELRQADFMLWWNDLSAPDPYFVLPVLFGISMWMQQKLSGQTAAMDPMQQKIMNAMPIMLTAFFAFFPVGLVLYWFVSNVIGIAQQWYITRKLEKEGLGHR